MFRMRTWVPGGLGRRSRGAWAAFPGSLERLPGAPLGGVPTQTTSPRNGQALLVFALKLMLFGMSIFYHFGLDLGASWGVIFGPLGNLARLSCSHNRL